MIGTWLVAAMAVGELACNQVVPEGLDDHWCEGESPLWVQVKSRQPRLDQFGATDAAKHILSAWSRLHDRADADPGARLLVVFEAPVKGVVDCDWRRPLLEYPESLPLRVALAGLEHSEACLAELLASTSIAVLPWGQAETETSTRLASLCQVPQGAALTLLLRLRGAVADAVVHNATVGVQQRMGISRTEAVRLLGQTAELIDVAGLEQPLRDGICEVADLTTPITEPFFYEGVNVGPGHVAAGLVIERPVLTRAVRDGLDQRGAVLIAGPSGIGKSAVLWSAVKSAGRVAWCHVFRLTTDDVEPLMRLGRALGASPQNPVGFAVDGVGQFGRAAWDALCERVLAVPGLVIIGSVRQEDLFPLRTASRCAIITPVLDEDLADRLHQELRSAGATEAPHWRESFDSAKGLTLEYTHLLTRGRRLDDVVGDQVRERIRERRDLEFKVLALVGVADQWGAQLSLSVLPDLLVASDADLRAALERLAREHLLSVKGGVLSGLHQLRSAAIARAAHAQPPPDVADTAALAVQSVPIAQLALFVANAFSAEPSVRARLPQALMKRLGSEEYSPAAITSVLHGARLADFVIQAKSWLAVLDESQVPQPMRRLALNFALLDSDLPDIFDPRLIRAVEQIRARAKESTSPLRDLMVKEIGDAHLKNALDSCVSSGEATRLLATLAPSDVPLTPTSCGTRLANALGSADVHALGRVLSAAALIRPGLADALLQAAGGVEKTLTSFRQAYPWLLDVALVSEGDEVIARAHLLHASDELCPDPEESVRSLGRDLLACFAHADRVDIAAVAAGGIKMTVGDFEYGTTGLLRRYSPGQSEVAWNRARIRIAEMLDGLPDETTRLSLGLKLLEDTCGFASRLAAAWMVDDERGIGSLAEEQERIASAVNELAPARRPGRDVVDEPDEEGADTTPADPIHGIVSGLVENVPPRLIEVNSDHRTLAAFVGDTLRADIARATEEQWALLGFDRPPKVLRDLVSLVSDLHAILAELAFGRITVEQMAAMARRVKRTRALSYVAKAARTSADRRLRDRARSLAKEARRIGVQCKVIVAPDPSASAVVWPPCRVSILIGLDSLVEFHPALEKVRPLLQKLDWVWQIPALPVREGATVALLAVALSGESTLPLTSLADELPPGAPPKATLPVTDAVVDAHKALETLSAIAWLQSQIDDPGFAIEEAAEKAEARLAHAWGILRKYGSRDALLDEVLVWLGSLAEQVQAELNGQIDDGDDYLAVRMAKTAFGGEESSELAELLILCAEFDLNPDGLAERLYRFTSSSDTPRKASLPSPTGLLGTHSSWRDCRTV